MQFARKLIDMGIISLTKQNYRAVRFRLRPMTRKRHDKLMQIAGACRWVVNPAYTSQTCSRCGHRAKGNRVARSAFRCRGCAYVVHADVNAAMNILASATGAAGRRGAFSLETPGTRQYVLWRGGGNISEESNLALWGREAA